MIVLPPAAPPLATLPAAAPVDAASPVQSAPAPGARDFGARLQAALGPQAVPPAEADGAAATGPMPHAEAPAASSPASLVPEGRPGAVSRWVSEAIEAQRRMDALISQAAQGRTWSAQDLLAVQARMHQHTFALEAFGKAVEQASNASRTVLGTQL